MKKIKTTRKGLIKMKQEGWEIIDLTLGSKGLIYELRHLQLNDQVVIAGADKELVLDILKSHGYSEKELESFDKDLIKYEEEFESYILSCKLN